MAEDTASTSASATSTVVLVQPQDPGTFSGSGDADVEDWLAEYECMSKNNLWDPTMMLENIIFYLTGTAKVWFDNHEAEIGSWDTCKEKFRELFGKPIGRKIAVTKTLASRA